MTPSKPTDLMRPFFLLSLAVSVLTGCTVPKEREPEPPVISGNPVRDDVAADVHALFIARAHKDAVLQKIGGLVDKVPDASYFSSLPHSEFSTLTIPPEEIARWSRLFSESAATYHAQCEGGIDFILFFDRAGSLQNYVYL